MKNYGKLISVIAVLIGLFVMSVSVSAADFGNYCSRMAKQLSETARRVLRLLHRMTRTENLQRL